MTYINRIIKANIVGKNRTLLHFHTRCSGESNFPGTRCHKVLIQLRICVLGSLLWLFLRVPPRQGEPGANSPSDKDPTHKAGSIVLQTLQMAADSADFCRKAITQ